MQKSKLETKDHAEIVAEMEDIFELSTMSRERMDYQMTHVTEGKRSGDTFDMFTIEKSAMTNKDGYSNCSLYPTALDRMTTVMTKYGFSLHGISSNTFVYEAMFGRKAETKNTLVIKFIRMLEEI